MLDLFKTLMVSLFQKPATLAYPKKPIEYSEIMRGHIEIEIGSCIFCGMCSRKCPSAAIEVDRAERTWAIERFSCVQCGSCAEVCPKKCLFLKSGVPPASTTLTKDLIRDARVPADTADH